MKVDAQMHRGPPAALTAALSELTTLLSEVRAAVEVMKSAAPPLPITARPVSSLEPPNSAVTRALKHGPIELHERGN